MNKLIDSIIEDAQNVINEVEFKALDGKSILITGASGLMGVHFLTTIRLLVQRYNYKIKTYSIVRTEPTDYFKSLSDFTGSVILRGDITDHDFLKSLPVVDNVIHAAGYGQPGKFMEDQIKTLKLNTYSTFELFEKLNPNGNFLFVSTSEVYSGLTNPPFNEGQIGNTNTDHARACYIEAKRCGEAIVNAQRKLGVHATSARLSLAYGPGTQKGDKRVLNSFIEKALQGKIAMMDHGHAMRTYCYVSDAIGMMWNILLHGKEAIYNVAGKSQISIKGLAEKIAAYLKVSVALPSDNAVLEGAPDNVFLDMTKVESEFRKAKYISLEDGLKNTIEWQKELYLH